MLNHYNEGTMKVTVKTVPVGGVGRRVRLPSVAGRWLVGFADWPLLLSAAFGAAHAAGASALGALTVCHPNSALQSGT